VRSPARDPLARAARARSARSASSWSLSTIARDHLYFLRAVDPREASASQSWASRAHAPGPGRRGRQRDPRVLVVIVDGELLRGGSVVQIRRPPNEMKSMVELDDGAYRFALWVIDESGRRAYGAQRRRVSMARLRASAVSLRKRGGGIARGSSSGSSSRVMASFFSARLIPSRSARKRARERL
jgi:hypothetical protein